MSFIAYTLHLDVIPCMHMYYTSHVSMSTDVIVWVLFRQPHCHDFMGETFLLYIEVKISQQTSSSVSYNLSAPTSMILSELDVGSVL